MQWIDLRAAGNVLAARATEFLDRELRTGEDAFANWRPDAGAGARARSFAVLDPAADVIAACGRVWPTDSCRFRMELAVSGPYRGRGVGTRLLARLVDEAARQGARTLQARADGSAEEAISFLTRRGFRETLRIHRFGLDPAKADLPRDTESRMAAKGITICTLADEQEITADVYARIGAVYDAASDEWPDPDPAETSVPLTGERVRAMYERWRAIPGAVFIARTRDDYVGFTGLCEGGKSVGTAVRPQFRGIGVATALKVRLIHWARAQDIAWLRSATAHPAMMQLNRRLGFQCQSVEVRLVRRFA